MMRDNVYRCDWCGRFYSSPLPEPSSCPNHIPEHNVRLRTSIEHFNSRLAARDKALRPSTPPTGGAR